MNLSFFINTKIFFGKNCFDDLYKTIADCNYSKIGVVIDHNLFDLPLIQELILRLNTLANTVIRKVTIAEPTYRFLEEFRKQFMETNIDSIIGIGGGSAMDTAKAMAVLVNNKEKAVFYRGFNKMTEPVLPLIMIPTTAGTGAEITPNASFVDDEINKKLGINGEAIRPKFAFLNPELLLSCPKKASVSAGIDALVHAVEAFASKNSTYISKMFSKEAVGLILNNLENAIIKKDMTAIENVFLGSTLAGIAMMNSGTGPAAAFSYPLGVYKKVPHGYAGGVFLPQIMEWNVANGYFGYSDFLPYLINAPVLKSQNEKALCVVDLFKTLWKTLDVPVNLREYGFGADDVDIFVKDILELRGAVDQNPIPINEKQIKIFLEDFL